MPTRGTRTNRSLNVNRKRVTKRKRTTTKRTLSPAQRAQRRYASAMRTIRARAKKARGGRGRIGVRKAAKTMRRKLGIKG